MSSTNVPILEYGEVVKRQMQFFWLVDYSGSMDGSKIATLNQAIREAIPAVKDALKNHPEVQIMMRVIKFSDKAEWHIGPTPVPLEKFVWTDLKAYRLTATASAIEMLVNELDIEKMNKRGFPPVCILLSDGFCTESDEAYDSAIEKLNKSPWGKKAVRLVIAIGNENDYDEQALLRFTNHEEIGILKAHNPEQLVNYIKWASTTASISSSHSKSNTSDDGRVTSNVILPSPPQIDFDSDDVF